MKILTIDTETTGLPPKNAEWDKDFEMWPRIIQLSWIYDGREYDYLINPEGYPIDPGATETHGITNEQAAKSTIKLKDVLPLLIEQATEADMILGHNLYFDTSGVKANGIRIGMQLVDLNNAMAKEKRMDTMWKSMKFCDIRMNGTARLKWPKLTELYEKLFGEEFNAHNSLDDVRATERCFHELVKREIIDLSKFNNAG